MDHNAKVISVSISNKKGIPKTPRDSVRFIENYGIEYDVHADSRTHRQVSLLAIESINKMRMLGLNVRPGSFAENITTEGINLTVLNIGERLKIGDDVIIEITQIGKECHTRCAIYYKAGDCVMPREGVFGKVIRGGTLKQGDAIVCLSTAVNNNSVSIVNGYYAVPPMV